MVQQKQSLKWLGNVRIPPETMQDLSDQEWFDKLQAQHGDKLHIGEPQEAGGHCAAYWDHRGLVGLYLENEDSTHGIS